MNTNETVSLSIITENERIQDNPKTQEEEEEDDDDDEGVDNNVGPSVGHEMDFQDGVYQMQDDSSIGDTSASCPINPDSLEEKQTDNDNDRLPDSNCFANHMTIPLPIPSSSSTSIGSLPSISEHQPQEDPVIHQQQCSNRPLTHRLSVGDAMPSSSLTSSSSTDNDNRQ